MTQKTTTIFGLQLFFEILGKQDDRAVFKTTWIVFN